MEFNHIALRMAKIVSTFCLSVCSRVNRIHSQSLPFSLLLRYPVEEKVSRTVNAVLAIFVCMGTVVVVGRQIQQGTKKKSAISLIGFKWVNSKSILFRLCTCSTVQCILRSPSSS